MNTSGNTGIFIVMAIIAAICITAVYHSDEKKFIVFYTVLSTITILETIIILIFPA